VYLIDGIKPLLLTPQLFTIPPPGHCDGIMVVMDDNHDDDDHDDNDDNQKGMEGWWWWGGGGGKGMRMIATFAVAVILLYLITYPQ